MSCLAGCQIPNRHVGECSCGDPTHQHDDDCPQCAGCLPARALDGAAVCQRCVRRLTRALKGESIPRPDGQDLLVPSLPDLWVDLAEKPRLAGVSAAVEGEGDGPGLPVRGPAVAVRSAIRAHLVTWSEILRDKHGMTMPNEATIAAGTRLIAETESDMAMQARMAALLMEAPAVGPLVPSKPGEESMRDLVLKHGKAAEAAREERRTGLDVVRALADHIHRHLGRLVADPDDAPVLADDLLGVYRQAQRVANPSRGANLRIQCSCGSRVQVDPDEIMTCPGCGNYGVVAWWVAQEAPVPADPLTLRELQGWLIGEGVIIHERKLRDWADNGIITAVEGGNGQPRKFDAGAVLIVARTPRRTRTARAGVRDVA